MHSMFRRFVLLPLIATDCHLNVYSTHMIATPQKIWRYACTHMALTFLLHFVTRTNYSNTMVVDEWTCAKRCNMLSYHRFEIKNVNATEEVQLPLTLILRIVAKIL